jgi:hypothetical protein
MGLNYDTVPGTYTYSQSALGKSASGVVARGAQSERDLSAQRAAGGADRQPGDQGGHLIAYSLGGKNDASNLDAQAANVNQKDQANVERNVSSLAENPNHTVAINVSNFNSVGERPDATMMDVGVLDHTTGAIDEQHLSFQNANHDLQASWSAAATQMDPEVDPSQNAGMTEAQREAANELCGAEDSVDMSLGSGCTYMEFDTDFLDAGEADALSDDVNEGEGEAEAGGEEDGLSE